MGMISVIVRFESRNVKSMDIYMDMYSYWQLRVSESIVFSQNYTRKMELVLRSHGIIVFRRLVPRFDLPFAI